MSHDDLVLRIHELDELRMEAERTGKADDLTAYLLALAELQRRMSFAGMSEPRSAAA